jgi:hypothetical protein
MSGKFGCTIDSSSMETIDYSGLIKAYERQPDFYKYAPPTNTASDIVYSGDEWAEVEKMGPKGADLIRLVKDYPAPDGWD